MPRSMRPMLVGAAVVLAAGSCAPSDTPVIPDGLSCTACVITSDTMTVLGTSEGQAALSAVGRVVRDKHGRYWVFSYPELPKLFDNDGAFIRTVGAEGGGPGEFRAADDMWELPGDSVVIRDSGAQLFHVFDPDLRFVRSFRVPILGLGEGIVLDWPDSVVVNAKAPRPPEFGFPLHLVDFSRSPAEVIRSFGGHGEEINSTTLYTRLDYRLAPAPDGYWTIAGAWYRITKWSRTNEEQFTLERRPDWFPAESGMSGGGPQKPPSPQCVAVREDEAGLLWAFCLTPSPRYQEAWPAAGVQASGVGEGPSSRMDPDFRVLYDTSIEVIDPIARRVVAREVLDAVIVSALPGREVAFAETSEGFPTVRIIEFSLHGYSRQ